METSKTDETLSHLRLEQTERDVPHKRDHRLIKGVMWESCDKSKLFTETHLVEQGKR